MEPSFEAKVKRCWDSVDGNVITILAALRYNLFRWASHIRREQKGLKEQLTRKLKSLKQIDGDDEVLQEMIETKFQLNWKVNKDELYREQRAMANRLKARDKNTQFFHKQAYQRKKKKMIKELESESGDKMIASSDMANLARDYFSKLFTSSTNLGDYQHVLSKVVGCISEEANQVLTAQSLVAEVIDTVKSLGSLKALGVDGFSTLLFQTYWHIIGWDVISFCLGILNESWSMEEMNQTTIVLIPKTRNPTSLNNFHPISLCKVIYKIV